MMKNNLYQDVFSKYKYSTYTKTKQVINYIEYFALSYYILLSNISRIVTLYLKGKKYKTISNKINLIGYNNKISVIFSMIFINQVIKFDNNRVIILLLYINYIFALIKSNFILIFLYY